MENLPAARRVPHQIRALAEAGFRVPALCSDPEMHVIRECGRSTRREKPEELNRLMLDWLQRRFTTATG